MLLLAVEWEEEAWRSECSEGNAGDWGRACFCGENNAEADVYWLLDAVMRRGLGVIYLPEGLDGHSVGADFLTLIQEELLKDLHPVLWAHLQVLLSFSASKCKVNVLMFTGVGYPAAIILRELDTSTLWADFSSSRKLPVCGLGLPLRG